MTNNEPQEFDELTSGPDISMAPIVSWDIGKLKTYADNNKKHPPEQIESLAKSIKDQGLNDPITVDKDGVIISGHGRFEAVKKLGWKKVAVRHLHMLSKAQADKLRIAANKTASNEYDFEALQRELNRLGGLGIDLDDIGLDERELDMMIGDIGVMDADMASEDITADVGEFEDATREASKEIDSEEITLSKAFGLSKIPLKAKRTATIFLAAIEKETGLEKSEALVKFMEDYTAGK